MRIIRGTLWSLALAFVVAALALPAQAACWSPDMGEGVLADVGLGTTSIEWRIFAEHRSATLTLSTPCGTIERTYKQGENPFFDIKELAPDNPDGAYAWQIRIEPEVSSQVQEALQESRNTGDEEIVKELCREGLLPKGPFIQTGNFTVLKGGIIDPQSGEEERQKVKALEVDDTGSQFGVVDPTGANRVSAKTVISGDLTVYNSLCVGFDCLASETYGADTIRLKENNLRIHADDTSTAASFPRNDWRLEFNSNLNGGGSYFRVIDVSANRNVMTVEAGAPSHSLYVDSSGDVGFGTSTPVVELHATSGDTPTLRLEQDTSSGFAAQTWDVAGNETSFFIRDATNGSTLPFRIRPGASSNMLVIDSDDQVGINTLSPDTTLTVQSDASNADVVNVRRSGSTDRLFRVFEANTGEGVFSIYNNSNGENIRLTGQAQGRVAIGCASGLAADLTLNSAGGGSCGSGTESTINAGATQFTITSSRTIKKNLVPVTAAGILDKIEDVDVYEYDFIEGPSQRLGLMAEDFHQIFQRGSERVIDGQEVQMALWLAVKELAQEKKDLNERVQQLETLVEALQQ